MTLRSTRLGPALRLTAAVAGLTAWVTPSAHAQVVVRGAGGTVAVHTNTADRVYRGTLHRSSPLVCGPKQDLRLDGVTLDVPGDGVIAENGCNIHIVNSRIIAGAWAVIAQSGSDVTITDSTLDGIAGALKMEGGSDVYAKGSRFRGDVVHSAAADFSDMGGNSFDGAVTRSGRATATVRRGGDSIDYDDDDTSVTRRGDAYRMENSEGTRATYDAGTGDFTVTGEQGTVTGAVDPAGVSARASVRGAGPRRRSMSADLRQQSDSVECGPGEVINIANVALDTQGDAIVAHSGCTVNITTSDIVAGGWAVVAYAGSNVNIVNSVIDGGDGAVITHRGSTLHVKDTTVYGQVRKGGLFTDAGGNVWR